MERQIGVPYILQTRPLRTQPDGVSLAAVIDVPDGEEFEQARVALDIVRRIHGDGNLPPLSVKSVDATDFYAAFVTRVNNDGTVRADGFEVVPDSDYSAHDFVHEIGHCVDVGILGNRFASRTNHPLLAQWRNAVENTTPIKRLNALYNTKTILWQAEEIEVKQHQIEYLLDPAEIFARSYTQYIATVTKNQDLKNDVARDVSHPSRIILYPESWTNEEFEPIAIAFEQLFAILGWVR